MRLLRSGHRKDRPAAASGSSAAFAFAFAGAAS
jgi:hypothetical protein